MPTGEVLEALVVSLRVASFAVLLDLVPGLALAWLLARRGFFGKSLVETLVALPMVLPPTAVGWLLLRSLGRGGPLESWGVHFLLTERGAVLAAAVMAFPFVVRTARVALEAVDPRLEKMGRSLGLGRVRVAFTITLPLARRGILAALVLGFGRALGEFGATMLVAGDLPGETRTLALAIYDRYQQHRDAEALELVGWTLVLAFATIAVAERLSNGRKRP